jgi:hypothetical protein
MHQDFRISGALAVLAALSQWVSRRILHRMAVEIRCDRTSSSEGDDIITVRHLTLFGTATKSYRRRGVQVDECGSVYVMAAFRLIVLCHEQTAKTRLEVV